MGIFDILKIKRSKDSTSAPSSEKNNIKTPPSTTRVFRMLGPGMYEMWECLKAGQNRAVELFDKFKKFKADLDSQFSSIECDRVIQDICIGTTSFSIKAKHAMYLYLLDLNKDVYISLDSIESTALLTQFDYTKIIAELQYDEIDYCKKLLAYIKENVFSLVQKTDIARFDITLCKHPIPFNSLEVNQYHYFIASEYNSHNSEEYRKWHLIYNAPFLGERKNSKSNPLILTDIVSVNAFVLDYLCYATIALPTLDITKVLLYRGPDGQSLKNVIIEKFGREVFDCIIQVIDDLNGNMFRKSVYSGLLIQ